MVRFNRSACLDASFESTKLNRKYLFICPIIDKNISWIVQEKKIPSQLKKFKRYVGKYFV